jgi:hypothetical protein
MCPRRAGVTTLREERRSIVAARFGRPWCAASSLARDSARGLRRPARTCEQSHDGLAPRLQASQVGGCPPVAVPDARAGAGLE